MPMIWTEPETFFVHRGVSVYHIYKDDDWESGVRTYWFTLDPTAGDNSDEEFDVRALSTHTSDLFIKQTIKEALDSGELELPEGVEFDDTVPTREVHKISLTVERYVYADNSFMVQAAYSDMMDDLKSVLPSNEFEARCDIAVVSPDDDHMISDWLREQFEDQED